MEQPLEVFAVHNGVNRLLCSKALKQLDMCVKRCGEGQIKFTSKGCIEFFSAFWNFIPISQTFDEQRT